MKTRTCCMFAWLIPFVAFAQSKHETKLEALYQKQQFRRCLHKAERLIDSKKHQQEAFPYLFKALALQQLLVNRSGKLELENIRQSYLSAQSGLRKDVNRKTFSHENLWYDTLIHYYHHLGHNLIQAGHKTEAKALAQKLANVFSDTLDYYGIFYPIEIPESHRDFFVFEKIPENRQDSIVALACQYQFKPYRYKGNSPEGFDDIGFIRFVYSHFGIRISDELLSNVQENAIDADSLQQADVLLFGNNKIVHAAIYMHANSNDYLIHASPRGILVESFSENSAWKNRPLKRKLRMIE